MAENWDGAHDGEPDDTVCMCEFDGPCAGLGTVYCVGCGGDLCVCRCGGERECPGCDQCESVGS